MISDRQTMGTVLTKNHPFRTFRETYCISQFSINLRGFRDRWLVTIKPRAHKFVYLLFYVLTRNTKLIYTQNLQELWLLNSLMHFWTHTNWRRLFPINSEVLLTSILCSQKTHCLSFTQMKHLMLFRNEIAFDSSHRATLISKLCEQAAASDPRIMTVVSEAVDGPWVKRNAVHTVNNIRQQPV